VSGAKFVISVTVAIVFAQPDDKKPSYSGELYCLMRWLIGNYYMMSTPSRRVRE